MRNSDSFEMVFSIALYRNRAVKKAASGETIHETMISKIAVKFNVKPVNNQGKIGLGRYAIAIQVFELSESSQDLSGFTEGGEGFQTSGKPESEEPWKE